MNNYEIKIQSQDGSGVVNYNCLDSIIESLNNVTRLNIQTLILDLTEIEFISFQEWLTILSYIEKLKLNPTFQKLNIKIFKDTDVVLSPKEIIKRDNIKSNDPLVRYCKKKYALAGYLEDLGTSDILLGGSKKFDLSYPNLGIKDASFKSFYTGDEKNPKVALPIMKIENKNDCKLFLDSERIKKWRKSMQERFPISTIFESEGLWRIFCHELSVNVFEHAGVPGLISGRVVNPVKNGDMPKWIKKSYPPIIYKLIEKMNDGFIELCVSDAGSGFMETLSQAYVNVTGEKNASNIDLLCFAFDIKGTCKTKDGSWLTEKHALGRILNLIAQYGGALSLRSGCSEIIFTSETGTFEKIVNKGYNPSKARQIKNIQGAHFQLIIPLIPLILDNSVNKLEAILPKSYRIQQNSVKGHLVPLYEYIKNFNPSIGQQETTVFKQTVEDICRDNLLKRSPGEAFVFDFSLIEWTTAQFETFLYLIFQSIQGHPTLLIEMDQILLNEIKEYVKGNAHTFVGSELVGKNVGNSGNIFDDISETYYLEPYIATHTTLMCIDVNGNKHILPLQDDKYENALLSLVSSPSTISDLLSRYHDVEEHVLRAILTNTNPSFHCIKGKWTTIWDDKSLKIEANRSVTRHFDIIAATMRAWRGRKVEHNEDLIKGDTGMELFYLPLDENDYYMKQFFESSRILTGERYLDEYAQRLIQRLKYGLPRIKGGYSLDSVGILAAVSASALLLCTALHDWWPSKEKPAILDAGYYFLLNPQDGIPAVSNKKGIVIVQDVINNHNVTSGLIEFLEGKTILCVISLIKFSSEIKETRITFIDEGWVSDKSVPEHSLIELPKPGIVKKSREFPDKYTYWVEPRSLRPFKITTLINGPKKRIYPGKEYDTEFAQNYINENLLEPDDGSVFAAGHYVYGNRHYDITIDIGRIIDGKVGDQIAAWIADICEGRKNRRKPFWECDRSYEDFKGEATFVLMPLHSKIHYLWPKIEEILAQRGRRLHMWLLDATLFLGYGPHYRLPLQLEGQIRRLFHEADNDRPIGIIIMDDAIFSGRTVETILDDLIRAFNKGKNNTLLTQADIKKYIKWIRYISIFNMMDVVPSNIWHERENVGGKMEIPFSFDEFYCFNGLPVYDGDSCPICKKLNRLDSLSKSAKEYASDTVYKWIQNYKYEIRPKAVDCPDFHPKNGKLPVPIEIAKTTDQEPIRSLYVDTAIQRFYELMYNAYPPREALKTLDSAWYDGSDEYIRYRWTVFDWCIRNWPRITVGGAQEVFFEYVVKEINNNSEILKKIFFSLQILYNNKNVKGLVSYLIDILSDLDKVKNSELDDYQMRCIANYEDALSIFILSIPSESLDSYKVNYHQKEVFLLEILKLKSMENKKPALSVFQRLYLRFGWPSGKYAAPEWALRTLYECLFRGYEPQVSPVKWKHCSLPSLIGNVQTSLDSFDYYMLQNTLSLFYAALKDIQQYAYIDKTDKVIDSSKQVLKCLLSQEQNIKNNKFVDQLADLQEAISIDGDFIRNFNNCFHTPIKKIEELLNAEKKCHQGENISRIDLIFVDNGLADVHILIQVSRFIELLYNWSIEPIHDYKKGKYTCKIETLLGGKGIVVFNLSTTYAEPEEVKINISKGRNFQADRLTLEPYGVRINDWSNPSAENIKAGFKASCRIEVPVGYVPKNIRI